MQTPAPAMLARDIEYSHQGTRMLGRLVVPEAPAADGPLPCIVLFHDAFGLTADTLAIADRLAGLGVAVLAADVWGDRLTPASEEEIGPLIGGMVADRSRWHGRVTAAHAAAIAQPEVDPTRVIAMGYCFGGSSALEHLRTGGGVRAAIAIHPGLDLLVPGWQSAHFGSRVLLCIGAEDPMADAEMRARLEEQMTDAGIDWELDLYSGTRHAFTSPQAAHSPMPHVVAYHPRNAARAWAATTRFLTELIDELQPITA
ncbi:dienelactone hydrolase family protein [Demequina iriomotensis]|uniref:dienelactone hydrolase family protein n=1 Tax=Demequina iriomotensis TaxID=1536641 RepID=UPI0007816BCC|nr:dienelactone hydrolase family protein [Demequina iriomotensis]